MFKKLLKIVRRMVLITFVIVLVSLSTILIIRKIKSEGIRKEYAITNSNGIDKEEIVQIGGIDQYLYIRGQNKENPIILIIHGGPGSPMTPLLYTYQTALEESYTVVNWDQRHTGKTYYLNDANEVYNTLTFERMVEDVKEVTLHLLDQFNQEKIIILGHSWGSALGTAFVQTYPDLVKAYIGTGQVIQSNEGDALAFNTALAAAKKAKQEKDVKLMENLEGYLIADPDFKLESFQLARKMSAKYLSSGIKDTTLRDLFFTPYYSLKELSYFLNNTFEIQKPLLLDLTREYDTRTYGTQYDVPVYYILGEQDWVTPTVTAVEFFDTIEAPSKQLILIEQAGHMAMINQPKAFCDAVLDVLDNS